MSILVKAIPAPKPRTDISRKISLLYAGILVLMAVAQLFTFEEFLIHMQSLGLPMGTFMAYVLGPLIIISEVLALPFLLRMSLSVAFRYLSMFLSWLAAGLWLIVSIWLNVHYTGAETVGYLGTVVDLMPGWWAIFISLALVILSAWSSWGLWPGKRTKH